MNTTTPSSLVVLHAFGLYRKGDTITDPVAVKAVLDGGKAGFVIATVLPAAGPHAEQEH